MLCCDFLYFFFSVILFLLSIRKLDIVLICSCKAGLPRCMAIYVQCVLQDCVLLFTALDSDIILTFVLDFVASHIVYILVMEVYIH